VRISGGLGAPRVARHTVVELLESDVSANRLYDVAVLVSELVNNSVRHAGVGPAADVGVELLIFADRVRLSVVDPGASGTPHVVGRRPDEPSGLGLVLVDQLATAWGVARDGAGVTRTSCDVPCG
jgi:anti-sigma regulatory factor (Ser/Thr protein kinase)